MVGEFGTKQKNWLLRKVFSQPDENSHGLGMQHAEGCDTVVDDEVNVPVAAENYPLIEYAMISMILHAHNT